MITQYSVWIAAEISMRPLMAAENFNWPVLAPQTTSRAVLRFNPTIKSLRPGTRILPPTSPPCSFVTIRTAPSIRRSIRPVPVTRRLRLGRGTTCSIRSPFKPMARLSPEAILSPYPADKKGFIVSRVWNKISTLRISGRYRSRVTRVQKSGGFA